MISFLQEIVYLIGKKIKLIRRRINWYLLFCLIVVTRRVVIFLPEATAYRLGNIVAGIWHRCSRRYKMRADQSLKTAFPMWDMEKRERVVHSVFQHLGRSAIELFRFYDGKYELWNNLHLHNLDRMRSALGMGKGLILISAHLGNWELLACALSSLGFPLRVVVSRIRDSRIDRLVYGSRSAAGVIIVFRDEPIIRLVRCLHRKEILGLLLDQDSHYDGVFVNHFNQPTFTARGPAMLALATGAPIVPVFIAREAGGHHRVFVEPPIIANQSEDREQEIRRITQCCMDVVESYIREFPDQWVWMHRRWKTRPRNSPRPEPRH